VFSLSGRGVDEPAGSWARTGRFIRAGFGSVDRRVFNKLRFGIKPALYRPVIGSQQKGSPKEGKKMKTSKIRYMIAAAALAVAAASASAQTYKAEIPLSFRAGETKMLPGTYQFDVSTTYGAAVLVRVRNLDTHHTIMLLAGSPSDAPKAWRQVGKPVIAFECTGTACALRRLWNGRDTFTYSFPGPAVSRGKIEAALITLTPVKSE
jgi:hypothetical protein